MPRVACVALALAFSFSVGLSAQQDVSPARRWFEGDRQPLAAMVSQGKDVVVTFEALQTRLRSGDQVVVTDERGRARRGRVVSISPGRLVMATPVAAGAWEAILPLYFPLDVGLALKRRLFKSPDRAFMEESVARIDIVDSTRNGTVIGGAVGVGFAVSVYLVERQQPPASLKGLGTFLAVAIGIPVSFRLGYIIDRAINEPIYRRHAAESRATLSPWLGDGVSGVVVHVRF